MFGVFYPLSSNGSEVEQAPIAAAYNVIHAAHMDAFFFECKSTTAWLGCDSSMAG